MMTNLITRRRCGKTIKERTSGIFYNNSRMPPGADKRAALRNPGSSEAGKLSLMLLQSALSTGRSCWRRKSAPRMRAETGAR